MPVSSIVFLSTMMVG